MPTARCIFNSECHSNIYFILVFYIRDFLQSSIFVAHSDWGMAGVLKNSARFVCGWKLEFWCIFVFSVRFHP